MCDAIRTIESPELRVNRAIPERLAGLDPQEEVQPDARRQHGPINIPGSKKDWAQGIATHEDMVNNFGTLPFVVPATAGGQTVFVKETP